MHRWIHHGPDHEEVSSTRAEPGSQGSAQANCPSSTCTGVQSSQHSAMPAAHSANRHRSEVLSAEQFAEEEVHSIPSRSSETHEQSRAEVSMQSSMQPEVHTQPATAAGSQPTQRHDSTAGAAVKAFSEAGSRTVSLDRSVVADMCSLFQDASVLVGMHPDQVSCRLDPMLILSSIIVVSA